MWTSGVRKTPNHQRRGAVAVLVTITLVALLGFTALTVDVDLLFSARAELQRSADAAALAAAGVLREQGTNSDVLVEARLTALEYVERNPVLGRTVTINAAHDVVFGRATYDEQTQTQQFNPTETEPNAVRVTVRKNAGSPNGALPLLFAKVFGNSVADVHATATAAVGGVPRDIVLAIDLSSSMNDDSELRHLAEGIPINLRDVWASLDGPLPSFPYEPGAEHETEYAFDNGPTIGAMNNWGTAADPGFYDPQTDDGLWHIPPDGEPVGEPAVATSLQARGYSADEVSGLMGTNDWDNRVLVLLGLAEWHSGKPGGMSPCCGDGDDRIESGELTMAPYPSFRKTWTWQGYRDYVAYNIEAPFRDRYGLKTFTEYLLRKQYRFTRNEHFHTVAQPLQAVKDGLQVMVNGSGLDDWMSLVVFAFTSLQETDLSDDLQAVADRLYDMQAGHYGSGTNIGGGLEKAIDTLLGPDARERAARVVVLMSDGQANAGPDPITQAHRAADEGVRVYTISVGADVDRALMQQIASITGGVEYYAAGSPEAYTLQLRQIFSAIGGMGGVSLVE